ncbi:MAG: hypothetical protein IT383_02205 [Deltaproteobacteria bacterium]|nr:hypothetical protein [Deltaproteobacteria bacterium]
MRSRIVEEVVRRGPADLAGKARALVPRTGNLALQLLELGYAASAILDGAAAATGVRQAQPSWLRDPHPPPVDYDDGLLFRQVGAAPVAVDGAELCVAYGDPVAAAEHTMHGLPPHRPLLAMPAQLARALALLPSEPTLAEAFPTDPTRRAAFAVRSEAPKGSVDDLAIDDDPALDEVAEATRTVPGDAPPLPPPALAPSDDDDAPATIAMNTAALRQVAHASNQGRLAGPASDEGAGFEELRTEQVDLVSPAGRAAVEPTVTATATTPQRPAPMAPSRPQPALRLPTARAEDDDDYEDVATVALTKGDLEALMSPASSPAPKAPQTPAPRLSPLAAAVPAATTSATPTSAPKPPATSMPSSKAPAWKEGSSKAPAWRSPVTPAPAPKATTPPKVAARDDGNGDDNDFNDPTEHVAVLASREQAVDAKTLPKRPTAAVPLTDPGPTATPRRPTPLPRAPTRPPQPRRQLEDPVELASTQPMPRHQPATEMEVVPVPVARRGPSPLASALSAVGKPVLAEPPPRVATPSARVADPPHADPPRSDPPAPRVAAGFSARHIPGFDDAPEQAEARRPIPGFDEALDPPAPPRKGRVMLLHPPDDRLARTPALQDTEAEPPAPSALDPAALQPLYDEPSEPDDPAPLSAQHDDNAHLDFIDERERDFSRAPLPAPSAPPPRAMPPLRFEQRAPQRPSQVEELDARAGRRGGGVVGGLQVLRAGSAPPPSAGLELQGEEPRPPAPQPHIPGIDSPMPSWGEAPAPAGTDRRSKQILVAATVIAVAIIVGAGVTRMRATRLAKLAQSPERPPPAAVALPQVPPPPEAPKTPAQPSTPQALHDHAAAADAGVAQGTASDASPLARQIEIVEEARRHTDPAMAIGMYSQAIELDPQSIAARDALFERAKLYLATGDREHARADVQKLKRRADTKDLERDLQLILDGASAGGGGP